MNTKKLLSLLLILAMLFTLCACGSNKTEPPVQTEPVTAPAPAAAPAKTEPAPAAAPKAPEPTPEPVKDPVELIVFAAASMSETLTEIGDMYMDENNNISLVFNFDSSGTLKTQIEEGAECDIFVSAAPKQMNALDGSKDADGGNPDGLDFVLQGSRFNLLENKVALAVPDGNPADINSYDDLVKGLQEGTILLAMGNSDVPVGQYTQKIFAYFGLDEEALAASGCLTYGSNVKEVTTQVKEGVVDCGIIYGSDAVSAELTVVDFATKDMCGQVIYPAAVLNVSAHAEEAQAFLDYLKTDAAGAVFESVGLSPLN